jgi:hypothetical protein
LRSERFEAHAADFGQTGISDGEVGGVIGGGAVGARERWESFLFGWKAHGGGVGFDEEAVGRDELKQFAKAGVPRGEVSAVERKVSAELGEGFHHFGGTTVGVEQKTARGEATGALGGLERFEQQAEGVDAVNRGRAIEQGGEDELFVEDRELFLERGAA